MQERSKAHIAVLLTNIFFATNFSLVKFISPKYIGPYGVNVVRVGVCLILFWLVWLFGKSSARIKKEHWWRFILCGLTGVALNQMLFIKGLTLTATVHASLLMLCTPLLITILAFWALKEKISWPKSIGLVLGIAGAVVLITSKENNGDASLQGDLLIVLNAISYALYFILVKPLMKIYPPLHVVRWVFTFGFILIIPVGWSQFNAIEWQQMGWTQYIALFAIVCCGTFLAYYFNAFGLQHLGAGITGSYIYTQPLFATLIAVLFLHEQFSFEKLIAGIFIFAGVYLVSRKTPVMVEE